MIDNDPGTSRNPEDYYFWIDEKSSNEDITQIVIVPKAHWDKYKTYYDDALGIDSKLEQSSVFCAMDSCYEATYPTFLTRQILVELGLQENNLEACHD